MQHDEYGAAALQLDYPRNERERTRILNERSDAREAVIKFAKSSEDARNLIASLGLDNDDDILSMALAEPTPSDASPAGRAQHNVVIDESCDFDGAAQFARLYLGNAARGPLYVSRRGRAA